MLRKALVVAAFLCGVPATLLTVWTIVPALSFTLFLVAVGASEWSLWFGAAGLLGAGLSLAARAAGSVWAARVALILSVPAVALSLIPPLESLRVAREHDIELSLGQYLFGSREDGAARVERTTETFAAVEGQTLKLDVYLAASAGTRAQGTTRAAVIVVHGGSWNAGERSDYPLWNEWLARQGYAVFDIDYRLSPQPNWRTATGDVKCAVGWVRANAARFAVDPARIALLGRSAGAHLALLAAYSTQEAALPPACAAPDPSVGAVVSLYAPTDLKWGYEHPANRLVLDGPGKIRNFVGGTPDSAPEAIRLASATTHVNARTPPTLLFHGGRDQLVSDRHLTLLAEKLRQHNVAHRALRIPYAQHGFDYNFDGWGSQLARPFILDFLSAHVGKKL